MSPLRSNYLRRALLPVLLLASLFLPTLHLHPIYESDYGGRLHQHAVIHADFLSVSADDHRRVQHENVAPGDPVPESFSQSSLSAILAHTLVSLTTSLKKSPDFFLVDVTANHTRLVLFTQSLKRDHGPPRQQLFFAPYSSRSPPSLA